MRGCRLVLEWVTIWESRLLYVFPSFTAASFLDSSIHVMHVEAKTGIRLLSVSCVLLSYHFPYQTQIVRRPPLLVTNRHVRALQLCWSPAANQSTGNSSSNCCSPSTRCSWCSRRSSCLYAVSHWREDNYKYRSCLLCRLEGSRYEQWT
jgi:hypothetical protein